MNIMNVFLCYDVLYLFEGLDEFLTSSVCLEDCQLSDGFSDGDSSEL